jgi:hypothetical protein
MISKLTRFLDVKFNVLEIKFRKNHPKVLNSHNTKNKSKSKTGLFTPVLD